MTRRADLPRTRQDFLRAIGVLLVTRDPPEAPPATSGQPQVVAANLEEGVEILLAVWDDGSVTALNGHVDLGTGIRTALAQIVAEELDVGMDCINMVLGDTASTPNQGATIASSSIQLHAAPLRSAAAQARLALVRRAAQHLKVLPSEVRTASGIAFVESRPEHQVGYGELLQAQRIELTLDSEVAVKAAGDYQLVGTSVARTDIPAKATGELTFVHDLRLPGMLHGRVVRPPYAGLDQGDFVGKSLERVDEASIAHIGGVRKVVVIRDFVGIVAEREEQADQALKTLQVEWKRWPGQPIQGDLEHALRAQPFQRRQLVDEGDVEKAMEKASLVMQRSYVWPYQLHASIGPSCAVAAWNPDANARPRVTVWAGTQNPHVLRADLALLLGLPDIDVDVIRMEAAGCYGRNCADDVAADAALLSRAVGAPVRVQLTREQENLWEPKGAAQLMEVNGGLNLDGSVAAYDFQTSYPSNGAPTLALLLTRTIEPAALAFEMGDRTARPPYAFSNLRVSVNDMAPILRASWLRGVSALPNSFAHESYIDELATAAGVDPVEFRLRHLQDARARELLQATAARAGWRSHTLPCQDAAHSDADIARGQGVAYARYSHGKWPGSAAAWSAWVADVEVNRASGEVHVSRVVVGQDAGLMINPAGVTHQIHGNVVQTTSRALKEQIKLEPGSSELSVREWGSYPILSFREVPVIDVVTIARPNEPPLGVGESASVPGTAAIANAIFDAIGIRLRQPPFTPEVVRAALAEAAAGSDGPPQGTLEESAAPMTAKAKHAAVRRPRAYLGVAPGAQVPGARWPARLGPWARARALTLGILGLGLGLLGWRAEIPRAPHVDSALYTNATLERGRQLAAMGDCAVCHTAPDGIRNAGGRAMETPFGTIYTSNITPDRNTGLGEWSFSAFQRAMRDGVSRDGRHLYPAFPYTSFARMTDDDLTALYAFLMAQPAVASAPRPNALHFPFSVRPLMAAWNGLFHDARAFVARPDRSADWNRGAYLVNGAGHCGACHTERNVFGAERAQDRFLAGAVVDGWEAPALNGLSHTPVPWNEDAFYLYLTKGYSPYHGSASGPMAAVVRELSGVDRADIRAISIYLSSFTVPAASDQAQLAARTVEESVRTAANLRGPGQRLFDGACGACHHDGDGPVLFGLNLPLSLSSKLHSERPDNLLLTVFDGVQEPAHRDVGYMPAFRDALDDRQIESLVRYMRSRFAPDKAPWAELDKAIARARANPAAPQGFTQTADRSVEPD